MWNPDEWQTHEHRIYEAPGREPYSDSCFPSYAVVDEEDYAWAVQWGWSRLYSRGNRKFYLRRAVTITIGESWLCERRGKRIQNRRTENLFLHVAILERMGIPKPTPRHIGGHLDDDSLNCRRSNLQWLTPGQNNLTGKGREVWRRRMLAYNAKRTFGPTSG
jgi:hypothetical protein